MNAKLFVFPALALGGTALLLAPVQPSQAFSKLGGSLNDTQRDVRVHDNFLDSTANNNLTPAAQFPGWLGVELAIWKGIVEWGSRPHGDGTGDPQNGNILGDGGANFDAMWAGATSGIGSSNGNIVSSLASCGGGGTLAYCETPISDGWRIRFCDEWTWDDGPATIGSRFDLQGVMAHEYGHALGLGHSATGQATMAPSVSAGSTGIRSIHADDIAGIQCVYGVASLTKPTIIATEADAGANTITIYGTEFDPTTNEIWFTNVNVTAPGDDPIVRVPGVASSSGNTVITLTIPAAAGPGDVMVNKPGSTGSSLSNAFPTDLEGTFGIPPIPRPKITSILPSSIDALIPGTDQTIIINGTDLDMTTDVLLDGVAIPASRYSILGPTAITLDMPQASSLGAHDLGVTDGVVPDEFPVTIVAPSQPKYELGTGDPLNIVDRDNGLPFIVSGIPGRTHRILASTSNLPSNLPGTISLAIGNNFSNLVDSGDFVIPASGWIGVTVPTGSLIDPGPGGATFYSQTFEIAFPTPFDVGNLQSMVLVQ